MGSLIVVSDLHIKIVNIIIKKKMNMCFVYKDYRIKPFYYPVSIITTEELNGTSTVCSETMSPQKHLLFTAYSLLIF